MGGSTVSRRASEFVGVALFAAALIERAGSAEQRRLLADWPLAHPTDWIDLVNQPQSEAELKELRRSVRRGTPLGRGPWQIQIAARLGLESTLRPRGRPRKAK